MDEEWDTDNFKEPITLSANKWEGEDEEDEVKDSWDAEEEEEKKDVEKIEVKPKQKPKKALVEKIAEKERQRQEEIERKLKEKEKEDEMSPEERLQKQKESDLQVALETTFGFPEGSGIDSMNPDTKEEFALFADALNKKLLNYAKHPEFPTFIEDHIRNICVSLSSLDLKKLKTTIDNMYQEKQKAEKGDKGKKGKGKSKAKLRVEGENTIIDYEDFDYDDFM